MTKEYSKKRLATEQPSVIITSDLGLSREISSSKKLAELIVPLMEDDFRNNSHWGLAPDVRCQPSGVISLITWQRFHTLRQQYDMFPCPQCIKWCKGEKGLWWHQQMHHQQQHEQATVVAQAASNSECAIVLYNSDNNNNRLYSPDDTPKNDDDITSLQDDLPIDPLICVQNGNLSRLVQLVRSNHQFQPATFVDRNGATALMWAAGGGHLEMVKYLLEECQCDPLQPQRGKRSFAGRTALHWASRNGHLAVVRYLVTANNKENNKNIPQDKQRLLEAATQDGTTAFGWACWQRHLEIMKFLHQEGCTIDNVNSFGCSPVLWCSQGTRGDGLAALKWLKVQGCRMRRVNNNGHGVLHKAAQRGQREVGEWFVRECIWNNITVVKSKEDVDEILALVSPDTEGYCPSDLAGMEGHTDFAKFLAQVEMKVCQTLQRLPSFELPNGYCDGGSVVGPSDLIDHMDIICIWERYGGLRRMKSSLLMTRVQIS
ncbi:ankyrin repeat domain protein [Nitzschia inconspicua]|uniref:Ankyrin repeat domain protein n=1 Tax=Nitzschia inconspicua TaxID=303405 RepID=A0A9K3M3P5_9STRA|nr:ankyrin repeat domain protein [Nitzschia inconspicua]